MTREVSTEYCVVVGNGGGRWRGLRRKWKKMKKENEGNFGKFPSEGEPNWAWRRYVVKADFLFLG